MVSEEKGTRLKTCCMGGVKTCLSCMGETLHTLGSENDPKCPDSWRWPQLVPQWAGPVLRSLKCPLHRPGPRIARNMNTTRNWTYKNRGHPEPKFKTTRLCICNSLWKQVYHYQKWPPIRGVFGPASQCHRPCWGPQHMPHCGGQIVRSVTLSMHICAIGGPVHAQVHCKGGDVPMCTDACHCAMRCAHVVPGWCLQAL